jgi:hypothetical protein
MESIMSLLEGQTPSFPSFLTMLNPFETSLRSIAGEGLLFSIPTAIFEAISSLAIFGLIFLVGAISNQ